ncbi:tyrosine--tRNA ligase [Patescibacteria group bacterium]|nr:tyrosine--tRNA ligase [Patescibacteria group bacterium]MBU4458339.1 tyrosine--tRNA ligase [Patescibacteria group bacterium]MCG2695906.1 tyrosine--tRNA ligase [Candidatus Portnoybacteria bacterium]
MSVKIDENKIEEILTRGVSEVIDLKHLRGKLMSGKKLRVKLGIDPTSPNIHIGRAVTLLKMKDFQELGHEIIFVIGDFTGMVGDTSDKDSERPMLSGEQVKKNMKNYVEQAGKIINVKKAKIEHNSKWLKKLNFGEISKLANQFSLGEFIARENIRKRLVEEKHISLRELLYPLLQGYDSIAIKADVELGGTDQRFNLLAGRTLQEHYGQEAQDILMTNLILGTDGRKMSSSWGNTINVTDEPKDMFGKVMSISDDLIITYFVHCTRIDMDKIREYGKKLLLEITNPRDIKMELAFEIVKIYWGEKGAEKGKKYFVSVFQKKDLPDEIQKYKLAGRDIVDVLVETKLATSRGDAKRLIEQGGIEIDGEEIKSIDITVNRGSVIQKGKRFFAKII